VTRAGPSFTTTETFSNTGSSSVTGVNLSLTAPSGWSASPSSSTSFATVPPGGSVQASWTVTPPGGTAPGSYELDGQATAQGPGGGEAASSTTQVAVPYSSLAAAFNDPGISDDANPSAGNFDGQGRSYSEQALSGQGLTAGATISHGGLNFTWPSVAAGAPDNVTAAGQAIALSGSGAKLGLLGAGDFGAASGTGTVVYSDGSTQLFSLTFADWWANKAQGGGDILATMPYVNLASGQHTQSNSVYYSSVSLQPGKTVQYVILPPDTSQAGATGGRTTMHVFAASIG
jgi:beta-glucosidase